MSKTPTRTLRIDDELWEAARAYAVKNGTNVTRLVEAHLRQLVNQPPPPTTRKPRGKVRASGVVSKEGAKREAARVKSEEEAKRASASKQQPPKSGRPNHSEPLVGQPRKEAPTRAPRAHHPGCSCLICKPPKAKG